MNETPRMKIKINFRDNFLHVVLEHVCILYAKITQTLGKIGNTKRICDAIVNSATSIDQSFHWCDILFSE